MAKNEKNVKAEDRLGCPKCGQTDIAIALDKSNKHYCQARTCNHVWVPGLDPMKRPDVVLKFLQEENKKLSDEITLIRKENEKLHARLVVLEATEDIIDGDEIFS